MHCVSILNINFNLLFQPSSPTLHRQYQLDESVLTASPTEICNKTYTIAACDTSARTEYDSDQDIFSPLGDDTHLGNQNDTGNSDLDTTHTTHDQALETLHFSNFDTMYSFNTPRNRGLERTDLDNTYDPDLNTTNCSLYNFDTPRMDSTNNLDTSYDSDSYQNSETSPDTPADLHEESIRPLSPPAAVTYSVGKSTRGAPQLISSDGYSYGLQRRNKNGSVYWRCVVRNSQYNCTAGVHETDGVYVRNQTSHVHPGVPEADVKNKMRVDGISLALSNIQISAMTIAKDLQEDKGVSDLVELSVMARMLNRHRQKAKAKVHDMQQLAEH